MVSSSEPGYAFRIAKGERRAYAIGAAIVIAASLVAVGAQQRGLARSREAFRNRSSAIAIAVREGLASPIEAVRTVPPYFAASGLVEADEFRVFVEPMLSMHPAITRVAFAPRILSAGRTTAESLARSSGFPDFAVRERYADGTLGPSRGRDSYLPILYCEPECAGARGLDLGTGMAGEGSVARHALTSREVTLDSRSWLRGGAERSGRVTVFAPLAMRDPESDDPRIPRSGVACIEVDVARAIGAATRHLDPNTTRLEILDTTQPRAELRLFQSSPGRRARPSESTEYVERFRVHGRTLAMRFSATPGTLGAGPLPILVAVSGVLLGVATTLAILFATRARRLRAEVEASKQLGPYRLIRRIGQGGMGTVYEAEHALLRRPTAVKVISDAQASPDALERFDREAKLTSQLTHPNTIVVFDFGRTESGVFYYAMEFIRGFTLDDVVRMGGAQPPARVVHILKQIAGSLAEAHATGFVHRDVKPSNVMVCTRGGAHDFVKVLDFGLVKDVFGDDVSALSNAGLTIGTPRYMAPEVFVDAKPPTPAADVYGVGAIAHYLLTGRELIEGTTMSAIIAHHATGAAVAPSIRLGHSSTIPADLDALVLRCLARDSTIRPANGEELRRALDTIAVAAWTEAEARSAQIGHDERYPGAVVDFSADDTLAIDSHARMRGPSSGKDGERAA